MLQYVSEKWQKRAALLFYMIFYMQFIGYAYQYRLYSSLKEIHLPYYGYSDNHSANNRLADGNLVYNGFQNNSAVIEKKGIDNTSYNNESKSPLTSGPGQPEMNSFRSVGADNMVNLFTGDFSYNIPLLDLGGYPVNLFYNAGISMEQEPTWVGLGWNLNPGNINRNMRGLPDDFDGSVANGDIVTKHQSIKQDLTVGADIGANVEIVGSPLSIGGHVGAFWNNRRGIGVEIGGDFAVEQSIAKKNGTERTANDSGTSNSLKAGMGFNLNSQSGLSLTANAGFETQNNSIDQVTKSGLKTSIGWSSRQGLTDLNIEGQYQITKKLHANDEEATTLSSSRGTSISFARSSYSPSIRMPMTKYNGNLLIKGGFEGTVVYTSGYLRGYISRSYIDENDKTQRRPAFGFMNYDKANGNENALLDFNRLNDGQYTLKTPVISIPNYTYDLFTINGEGTGGSFRGYRGNMGFVRDNKTESREGALNLSFDVGGGYLFHGGLEVGGIYSKTIVGDWEKNNLLRNTIAFDASDKEYLGFYFKNPGEKAIIDEDYYNGVGKDQLMRPALRGGFSAGPIGVLSLPVLSSNFDVFDAKKKFTGLLSPTSITSNSIKRKRDRRSQIITYLTAEEAQKIGLDKSIKCYTENDFRIKGCHTNVTEISRVSDNTVIVADDDFPSNYRKPHHLSEIDVLETDGKRYVYGLPVYTTSHKEVSFSVGGGNNVSSNKQLVSYSALDASTSNSKGRDNFYQSEETPAYAHSFLLTAILSPDYVDINGDGITDDDMGTAVKFNYTRVNKESGRNAWMPLQWRSPFQADAAHYNEGLKTDNADDKGLYTYGTKELWYAHSIESKNMIATFTISNREDGYGTLWEFGGRTNTSMMKKLDRIDLYTKAEKLKAEQEERTPRPVKTVHFAYSYNLCKNTPTNNGTPVYINNVNVNNEKGKLTLDSIWFSYNGNYKQAMNKYRFKYASAIDPAYPTKNLANPSYAEGQSDRWGTFKDKATNPSMTESGATTPMQNGEFPYTLQGSYNKQINGRSVNDIYASAWNLEKIQIPSGAVINVTYEADDYGYVQNRRAAQMTKIAGFGALPDGVDVNNELYKFTSGILDNTGKMDKMYVYFETDENLTNKEEILSKYLSGINQLLLKLWVEMPANNYGEGYEPINVYATFGSKAFGIDPTNSKRFWVKLDESETGGSPVMETVMQFLKDYLPSKAYKGYDNGNEPGLQQFIAAIQALGSNFVQAVKGFERDLKGAGKCKYVNLEYSFGRLNSPYLKKAGGGHRVKRIVISDNWRKMIAPNAPVSSQLDSYYGQEYAYTTTGEIIEANGKPVESSGVASYEPGIGNEENPFREVLKYSDKQPLGPTNINNVEMPVGETFFPSPSVGYSKVTVKSINRSKPNGKTIKSSTGIAVTEFYTTKDFPVFSDFTDFDAKSRVHHKPSPIMKFMFASEEDFMTLTQGFRVLLNDMNGKMKSQASYAEGDFKNPINYTRYVYKQKNISSNTLRPENYVRSLNNPNDAISDRLIGREIEVMNDFREHYAYTHTAKIPSNIEAFMAAVFPILIPSIFDLAYRSKSIYRSATTLKIVTDYGILDSVINIDKGSVITTKNLLYDGETGEVLVSQTNNAFDKPVYNLNYPARWVNSGMEMAYKNIDVTYKNVRFEQGELKSTHVDKSLFESGDEIYVVDKSPYIPIRNSNACINLGYPTVLSPSDQSKIWAVDMRKDLRNNQTDAHFIFIDRYGTPYNAANATIRIVRSGKRNMGSISVGGIVSLANPIVKDLVTNKETIKITAADTKVLNASAVEFKEKWRAEDGFYTRDTITQKKQYVAIHDVTLYPLEGKNLSEYEWPEGWLGGSTEYQGRQFSNTDFFNAEQFSLGNNNHTRHRHQSWLRYSVNQIPQNAKIKSAKLNLYAHTIPLVGSDNSRNYLLHNYEFHNNHHEDEDGDPQHDWATYGHSNNDPQYSSPLFWNNFRINRIYGTWPHIESPYYSSEYNGYYNQVEVAAPGYSPSQENYTENANSPNDAVDIKGLMEGMVRDYHSVGRTPTLKISMLNPFQDNEHNSGVCFFGNSNTFKYTRTPNCLPSVKGSVVGQTITASSNCPSTVVTANNIYKPVIHVKYSICSEALDEGVPPPAGEYDSCITEVRGVQCLSVFDRKTMNPYVHGILGNWRPWRSYVFYDYRKEKDVAVATDISKDGTLGNFENFWEVNSTAYLQKSNSAKWVWNSETTQFNRKGAEIENHDPLGRYNSGLYGYLQTLPIATANNARARETAFEGFEDLFYSDEGCSKQCNPPKRHFKLDVQDVISRLDPNQHHTGKYSLRVNAGNSNYTFDSYILPDDPETTPDVRIKNDGEPFNDINFHASGNGLTKREYGLQYGGIIPDNAPVVSGPFHNVMPTLQSLENRAYSAKWTGSIQPEFTGDYKFSLGNVDDYGDIYITVDDDPINVFSGSWDMGVIHGDVVVHLERGKIYPIKIIFNDYREWTRINLQWLRIGSNNSPGGNSDVYEQIPRRYLYSEANPATVFVPNVSYCYHPEIIQAINHQLIDSFCLIPGKKYVLSAWVKEGAAPGNAACNVQNYTHNAIEIFVNDVALPVSPSSSVTEFRPTGPVIEGWQRYEFVFEIPTQGEGSTPFAVKLKNKGHLYPVYFDDLKISPYNSNMKSFVYDPVNLRLTSELDENNYATFYEYDDEGTLIRVKKETVKGIKTIKETRSGIQKSLADF